MDLVAWQEGHKLVLQIYGVTKKFPKEEQFGIVSQLRRASVSVTSNIAEGFRRNSYKEKAQFYTISLSSLSEIENQLLISQDLKYVSQAEFQKILNELNLVGKLIQGLIKSSFSR